MEEGYEDIGCISGTSKLTSTAAPSGHAGAIAAMRGSHLPPARVLAAARLVISQRGSHWLPGRAR